MKTSGYNFQDILEENKKMDSIFSIEGDSNMNKELRIKKKKKFNFDHLFPTPKNNENMGMDDFGTGKPFEGLL